MSYNSNGVFTAGICVEKLMDLADIKGNVNDPLFKRSPLGWIEAVTSPLNKTGVEITTQEGAKEKSVRIKWMQRDIQTQVRTSADSSCTDGDYADFDEETISLSNYVRRSMKFKTSEIKKICEGRGDFMKIRMKAAFDAITREINETGLTDQALNFGINVRTGSATASDLTVFPNATGAPNARPLQIMKNDYNVRNQFVGTMILIGAGNAYDYWTTLEASCCNDGGVDMLALSNRLGWSPFIDTQMETVLGTNHFMVMEPGAVQFLTFNDYVGEDATSAGASVARGTIKDPRTGIVYDLKVLQDDCSDDWTVIISLTYDFWFTPISQYHFDDPLRGTRGTLRYRAQTS